MERNLPDWPRLLGLESERLGGLHSWDELSVTGRNNLERVVALAQENIYRMLADHDDPAEMQTVRRGIDYIRNELLPEAVAKPMLPRLRNELFRANDRVCAYLGDTPGVTGEKGWRRGRVAAVDKAFNKDWKDGRPNSGYFWKVTVEFAENVFPGERRIAFSTTEPRVVLEWEYDYLKNGNDPAFRRVFAANAFREWRPLWWLERDLPGDAARMDMQDWLENGAVVSG